MGWARCTYKRGGHSKSIQSIVHLERQERNWRILLKWTLRLVY